VKVKIDVDERYPVYSLKEWGKEVHVDKETFDRWELTQDNYDRMQHEMREVLAKAYKKEQAK